MATRTYSSFRGASQKTQEAEKLLARYPRLNERELAWLIEIFPALPPIGKAVMAADERLSAKLAAFYRDHSEKLHLPAATLSLSLLLPIMVTSAALWWFLG
ncbi:MAG TPA: hypothetical protein VHO04_13425 [Sphingopyxis sp.]|jgi:hypothetical protein|uniref:hypothetical protein n=1 Tax=Sphingopyxis sp. TaxID=1908224 RepID=UPI002E2F105F|nr:hypothetical protein [Sphingopyxis sp.]HEX2813671.1 hypothetical protein [Sphingopyxis sp.]